MVTSTALLAAVPTVLAQTSAGNQIRHFAESVLTPGGLFAAGLFVVGVVVFAAARPLRWWGLGLLLYATSLGFMIAKKGVYLPPMAWPLETLRHQGRGLSGALLVLLLLPAVLATSGWRRRVVGAATLALFAFELTFSARVLMAGLYDRALGGVAVYVLLLVVLGIGLGRWLQTPAHVRTVFRAIAGCAGLLLLGTLYQLAMNPAAILPGNRLMGTTGNPQFLAATCALVLPPIVYLLVNPGEPKPLRIAYAALGGFLMIFLAWTGSRTGALMAMIGLGVTFRFRLGKLLGVAVACGVFVLLALQMFAAESADVAGRLLSVQDTRSQVWRAMLGDFLANPLLGLMVGRDVGVSESSYLSTAARSGLFGLVPLVVALLAMAAALARLQRRRRLLGEDALLADVATGGVLALLAGSLFEGFLLGTISFPITFLYVQLAVVAFLIEWADATAAAAASQADGYAWTDEAGAADHAAVGRMLDADAYVHADDGDPRGW